MASSSPMDVCEDQRPPRTPPADTTGTLDPNHESITILALRMSSRRRLGMFLNNEALPLPSGLLPNYQGLAELIGFEFIEQLSFQRERDPTQALLMEWGNRPELRPTLGSLVSYLEQLERPDILEECSEIIRNDAEHFLKRKASGSSDINPVQDCTVSQSPFNIDDMKVDETAFMTIQDVEAGKPTYYDAFVCYHPEGKDLQFVKEMIAKVESAPYNLRLFVPHRDDLPGASKYVISAKLIQDRCKRMVIVMSPCYLQSDACDFQTKFAHALSPGSRSKKLVPVMIQFCVTPNILRHVTMCDYTRGDMTGWFWDRLIRSLQAPLNPGEITIDNPADLSDLNMNLEAGQSMGVTFTSTLSGSQTSLPLAGQERDGCGARSGSFSEFGGADFSCSGSPSRCTPPKELSSPGGDRFNSGKKKKAPASPLSTSVMSMSSSTPPGSPVSDRKGGHKKKSLKSKLTSVFSSSSSSHSSSNC